jgi:glycosyltransferase involved in cell wall biosynthesis
MVANAQLLGQIKTRPAYLYYGVAQTIRIPKPWTGKLQVLFSGHLSNATGVDILINALLALKEVSPRAFSGLRVIATGDGDLAAQLREVADNDLRGFLEFRGRVSDREYREVLRTSHIGLCLKKANHSMGQSTFPSKVVEFASWGLLVVSYKVSDVSTLFPEDGAILLEDVTAHELGSVLKRIVEVPSEAQRRAETGQAAITKRLNPQSVAQDLARLWLGHPPSSEVKGDGNTIADRVSVDIAECG